MSAAKIKFCGIRRHEDISYVNETRPDYIGFIFAESKRKVSPEFAEELRSKLTVPLKTVGVFVNCNISELKKYNAAADIFQLHGDEDESYIKEVRRLFPDKEIWKAIRLKEISDIKNAASLSADKYVIDAFSDSAYGGTGKRVDIKLLAEAEKILSKPYFIAGGINSENISETIAKLHPFGIDLSSGIETDGCKDLTKMKTIIKILEEDI